MPGWVPGTPTTPWQVLSLLGDFQQLQSHRICVGDARPAAPARQEQSGARLWQVQRSQETPSQGFRHQPGGVGKGPRRCGKRPEQHEGTAGLSLGTRGAGMLWPGQGLVPCGARSPTHVCTQAAPQELGSAWNVPSQPPSPRGFPHPSAKVPLAAASPGARQERLRAAHRAALLIPPS